MDLLATVRQWSLLAAQVLQLVRHDVIGRALATEEIDPRVKCAATRRDDSFLPGQLEQPLSISARQGEQLLICSRRPRHSLILGRQCQPVLERAGIAIVVLVVAHSDQAYRRVGIGSAARSSDSRSPLDADRGSGRTRCFVVDVVLDPPLVRSEHASVAHWLSPTRS